MVCWAFHILYDLVGRTMKTQIIIIPQCNCYGRWAWRRHWRVPDDLTLAYLPSIISAIPRLASYTLITPTWIKGQAFSHLLALIHLSASKGFSTCYVHVLQKSKYILAPLRNHPYTTGCSTSPSFMFSYYALQTPVLMVSHVPHCCLTQSHAPNICWESTMYQVLQMQKLKEYQPYPQGVHKRGNQTNKHPRLQMVQRTYVQHT